MAPYGAVRLMISPALLTVDRWACRLGLVLEGLLLAWTGGRAVAGHSRGDLDHVLVVVAATAATLVVALTVHGRAVLGFGADKPAA